MVAPQLQGDEPVVLLVLAPTVVGNHFETWSPRVNISNYGVQQGTHVCELGSLDWSHR